MRLTNDRNELTCEVCRQHTSSLEVIYVGAQTDSLALCESCLDARRRARKRLGMAVIRDADEPQRG